MIIVIVGGYFLLKGGYQSYQTPAPAPAEKTDQEPTAPNGNQQPTGEVKEFNMTAKKWDFNPNTITVNKGDTVKLHIESIDVTHGFGLSEFGINKQLEPGKTIDVEFVADKTGTFTFRCTVICGSGHSGMNGQLIIK